MLPDADPDMKPEKEMFSFHGFSLLFQELGGNECETNLVFHCFLCVNFADRMHLGKTSRSPGATRPGGPKIILRELPWPYNRFKG